MLITQTTLTPDYLTLSPDRSISTPDHFILTTDYFILTPDYLTSDYLTSILDYLTLTPLPGSPRTHSQVRAEGREYIQSAESSQCANGQFTFDINVNI